MIHADNFSFHLFSGSFDCDFYRKMVRIQHAQIRTDPQLLSLQAKQMNLRSRIGIFRSVAMYYWKPFNRKRLRNFYRQFIAPGDLCFDIGAHLGNRTNAWLDLGARVVAVEPQPDCVDFLTHKFGKNSKVQIVAKGVSGQQGRAQLHISKLTPTISTVASTSWRDQINSDAWYEVKWEDTVEIEMVTLQDLIDLYGEPSFCKIDIENHEFEALSGLTTPIKSLSFEYYPPFIENAVKCIERLEKLGKYRYNWSFGESQKLEREVWIDAAAIVQILLTYSQKKDYGDVYARLVEGGK